jgi:hypothetical protein
VQSFVAFCLSGFQGKVEAAGSTDILSAKSRAAMFQEPAII